MYTIRDANPSDAEFLARCIMAGMHFFDFETDIPPQTEIYLGLVECCGRDDTLYTYRHARIAEAGGKPVGALLSYPGDIYRELRDKTFRQYWPAFFEEHQGDDPETGPGEYYLDSLAVLPEFRNHSIGRALLEDGIRIGLERGHGKVTLVADSDMPHLLRLYADIGFVQAEHRHTFGVDFIRMVYTA